MSNYDEDAMPCGDCYVCGNDLDHSDAGFCEKCGNGFHWNQCGGWQGDQHVCNDCQPSGYEDGDEVTCISLWQPWASLMACGAKKLETRHWNTHVRGRMGIHASKTLKGIRSLKGAPQVPAMETALGIPYDRWAKELPFGAVIATGELVDTQPAEQAALTHPDQLPFGDFTPGRWVHCYEKLKRCLPIVPMKGRQGFFNATLTSE